MKIRIKGELGEIEISDEQSRAYKDDVEKAIVLYQSLKLEKIDDNQ